MKSILFRIDPDQIDLTSIKEAAGLLREGKTVAFPTETVYGLGANALDGRAVKEIFRAKGRPGDNPLIVHISSINQVDDLVQEFPEKALALAKKFWPGPLTMIMKKSEVIPDEVSAGLSTVGIRLPSNEIARTLIHEAGIPIAAPSANLSGKPSPTTGEAVIDDLTGRVNGIITSDDSEIGVESTVIDMTQEPPVILRPGFINQEAIEEIIGEVKLSEGITTGIAPERPASPGMKYTHYSPEAKVILVQGEPEEIVEKILEEIDRDEDKNYSVFLTQNSREVYSDKVADIVELGQDPQETARNLYAALREADKRGIDIIYVEQFPIDSNSIYVADRLLHASGYTMI